MPQPETAEELEEPLKVFGLADATPTRVPGGKQNSHWRVTGLDGSAFVLRRYHARRTRAAIEWEHALIARAAANGWPVAQALPTPRGPVVESNGSRWSLFPLLEGSHPEGNLAPSIIGRLLSRLHHGLARSDGNDALDAQRPGFGSAWELDQFVLADGHVSFNALLQRFAGEHPELGRHVRALKYRNLRELARLQYGDRPTQPIHGDFSPENLLVNGPQLTGLLDFDSARRDTRAFDIAQGLWLGCPSPSGPDAISPRLARAFLQGYAGDGPIAEQDTALIVPLIRAAFLGFVLWRMLGWAAGEEPGRAVASIARTLQRRVPALDATGGELEAVVRAAGAGRR
jgi:Ser/Thr protein kinase RdoA (MazF antagonist)